MEYVFPDYLQWSYFADQLLGHGKQVLSYNANSQDADEIWFIYVWEPNLAEKVLVSEIAPEPLGVAVVQVDGTVLVDSHNELLNWELLWINFEPLAQ